MLFFVISGFCIHLPQAARDTPVQLRSYCLRRFFRIFPPYVATLVFCLLVEMAFRLSDQPRGSSAGIFVASFTMVQNYVFQGGQVPSNPSLWSIPVEVELYIAYPLLLAFLRARGWSMGAGLILTAMFSAVAMAFYAAGWSWPDTNFLKFWVLWWSGAWLAERWRKGELPAWGRFAWLCTGVVTASLLAGMHWNWDHAYLHFVWGAVSFLLLWRCLCGSKTNTPHSATGAWLAETGAKIGVISYSLYLIHFPVLQLLGLLWRQGFESKPSSFLIPVMGSVLCIPIAWFFYRFIEMPSHQLGKRLARSN
jgi:peptidoglycan/LPS O-acetylase OafA/YrhL